MKVRKILIIIFLLLANVITLSSEIRYKISGRVVYNGEGINDINIDIKSIYNIHDSSAILTDKHGYFSIYLTNGDYHLELQSNKGFVGREVGKMISVNSKNVNNVIFFLERGCTVSGSINWNDNTPIPNAQLILSNPRGVYFGDSNALGGYSINNIRFDNDSEIRVIIPGVSLMKKDVALSSQGLQIENIDFMVEKRESLIGTTRSKLDQSPIVDMLIAATYEDGEVIQVTSDNNGSFKLYNLKKGYYAIIIFKPGHKYFIKEVYFSLNEKKTMTFEIEKEQ